MPADLIGRIEAWATENGASRSEALRRLVEIGLAKAPKSAAPNPSGQAEREQ
jgi:hypothetical protein